MNDHRLAWIALVSLLAVACTGECKDYREGTIGYPSAVGEEVEGLGDRLVITYARPPGEDVGHPYEAQLIEPGTQRVFDADITPQSATEYAIDLRQVPPGTYAIRIEVRQEPGPATEEERQTGFCGKGSVPQPAMRLVRR